MLRFSLYNDVPVQLSAYLVDTDQPCMVRAITYTQGGSKSLFRASKSLYRFAFSPFAIKIWLLQIDFLSTGTERAWKGV